MTPTDDRLIEALTKIRNGLCVQPRLADALHNRGLVSRIRTGNSPPRTRYLLTTNGEKKLKGKL